jgi:hypothetical protein
MTSKKNRHNKAACNDDHHCRTRLMAWDSPLLTEADLGHHSRSRSCGRSPRGAGHGSWGDGIQHPPNGIMARTTSHALAEQQQTAAAHQRQADKATRATALAAKALADEGECADIFAVAHCQAMASGECQSQEDEAACRERGSALRAPAPVWAQAASDCQERGSALHAPAPAWAKSEARHPRTPAEVAGYDEAKRASASNRRAEAKADCHAQTC